MNRVPHLPKALMKPVFASLLHWSACRGPTPVGCSQLVVSDPISTEGLTPQLTTKIQPNSTVSCQDGANGGHWFSVQLGKTMWGTSLLFIIEVKEQDDR